MQSGSTESHPSAFMCHKHSNLHKIPNSYVDWPVPAPHMFTSERIQHTCAHYLMHVSHIDYRLCCSFISPLHLPPPLMWDIMESEEYHPREWNSGSVLLLSGRSFPLISSSSSLCFSLQAFFFCCFRSSVPSSPPVSNTKCHTRWNYSINYAHCALFFKLLLHL